MFRVCFERGLIELAMIYVLCEREKIRRLFGLGCVRGRGVMVGYRGL